MTQQELIAHCLTYPGSAADYPFGDDHCVIRHSGSKKWFALTVTLEGRLCVNLKCEPQEADFLRQVYRDCRPGWHMNKQHWNTIFLDGDVPEEELFRMIGESYRLTKGGKGSK